MEEFEKVLQRFLDYYKSYFKDNKDIVVIEKCETFIRNYFDDLYKKIYDMSETTIFSLSERDTQIVRTRFGVYDNGDCQIYKTIVERFGYKCPKSILAKFERKIFAELGEEVIKFLITVEHPDEQFIDTLQVYLGEDIINLLKNAGIRTVQDLLRLTQNDVINIKDMNMIMSSSVISVIHSLGYKFADEKDNVYADEDYLLDIKRLAIVRKLLEKRNDYFECQKVLSEMKNQIASLMIEMHAEEKRASMMALEIKQLESELRNLDNQFKKTYF